MTAPTIPANRAPADWIRAVLRVAPAQFPVGHSLRAGLAVGLPFVVGALLGQTFNGMWVGLATLLLAAGEREGSYRLHFSIIAVSTPIAACGLSLANRTEPALPALVLNAAVGSFAAGAIAGPAPAFSIAVMQFYALLLASEMLVISRRPQQIVLVSLLGALSDLAATRAADLADDGDRAVAARRQATSAPTSDVGVSQRGRLGLGARRPAVVIYAGVGGGR